jgi:hypothetical protein
MAMILMTFVTDHNPYSNDDTIGELKSIENLLSIYDQLVHCFYYFIFVLINVRL